MKYINIVCEKPWGLFGLVTAGWAMLAGASLAYAENATPSKHADIIITLQPWHFFLAAVILMLLILSWMWLFLYRRAHITTKSSLQLSERQLREAQQLMHLGSWELDLVNDKLYWSDETYRIFELDKDKFVASYEAFLDTIHPEDRESVNAAYTQSLQDKSSYEITHRLLMPDGRIKWVRERCESSYGPDGEPVRSLGTIQDISNVKRMQTEILKSKQIFNTVIENIPAMVFLKSAKDLSYTLLNKVGENILERRCEDVVGKTDLDLFSKQEAELNMAMDRKILEDKQTRIIPEVAFRSPSGWLRYLYVVKTVLCNEQGQATHLLVMAIDITDRKLTEESLRYSRQQLQDAQRIAKLGNWSLNFENHQVYWSEELYHILGLDSGIDKPSYERFLSLIHPDDIVRLKESEARSSAEGTPHNLDVRIFRQDGETRWVHVDAQTITSSDGKPKRLMGTLQDITERKIAEQSVAYGKSRLRSVLDTAVDGIIIIDSDGTIDSVNPSARSIFGYEDHELLGNNVSILMPEPYHSAHDQYLKQYQATNEAKIIGIGREVLGRRKDGSTFPLELAVSEIKADGKRMFTGFVRDISERKQHEVELIEARDQAEQANRAKSEFLSSMSHELRTPLNAILGFAQLLQTTEPPLAETQQEDVVEILTAGEHLLALINGLLDLSVIESGRMDMTIESVPLYSVISACKQMIEPILVKHQVSLVVPQIDSKLPAVMADQFRLRQILLNLLSNAVKYNRPNGSVTVRCQQLSHARVRIEVEDTGIGIAPERLAEVFTAFSRLGAETTAIEGTGIGLAITRQLVELMQGEIGVDSQLGVGTTFWLELPGVQAEGLLVPVVDAEEIPETIPFTKEAVHTILYIEDNPANLRLMTQLLRRYPDFNLLIACEPLAGITIAQTEQPDLILLDINLPDIDGYGVLRRLQASAMTCNIPVVAVSANAMMEEIERALQAGFRDYCTKPIDIQKLMLILGTILDKERAVS